MTYHHYIGPAALLATLSLGAAPSAAQDVNVEGSANTRWDRVELRGEPLAGLQLPEFQRDMLGYRGGLALAFRPAYRFHEMLAVQLGLANQWFPADDGDGGLLTFGPGFRVEPKIEDLGRLFVDLNAGWGRTEDRSRFAMDAGAGFEFDVHPLMAVGPTVRYSHLFATSSDHPKDAMSLWGGISFVVRMGEEPPPPVELGESDSDGDGILDHLDECPTVPEGDHPDPNRPGCPASDRDNDGVFDPEDQCPDVHSGQNPDPRRPGCPQVDRDNDMIPDRDDACPDKPGAPSDDPKEHGCPSLVHIEGGQIHINKPVFFATNKDRILPTSEPVLTALKDLLEKSPFVRKIMIEGYTDDRGTEAYNQDLSERRAKSVRAWLVQNGIDSSRIETRGFGESRPLIPKTTDDARSVNRRVEFHIIDPPQPRHDPKVRKPGKGGAQ